MPTESTMPGSGIGASSFASCTGIRSFPARVRRSSPLARISFRLAPSSAISPPCSMPACGWWSISTVTSFMRPIMPLTEEESSMAVTRRRALAAAGAMLSTYALSPASFGQGGGQGHPIRLGRTLPLSGALGSLAIIHNVTAEICVENLNQRRGLLGRPVEWVLRDDQSKPELTRTLYEQLITADKVDLVQSPYATASILAAMGVAQRYGKVLLHTSFGIPKLAKYDMQFQTAGSAFDPENVWPNLIFDAQ